MAQSPMPSSWFQRLRGSSTPPQTDWADLGTAYGLDQSLRGSDTTEAAEQAKPETNANGVRPWWARLGGGSASR